MDNVHRNYEVYNDNNNHLSNITNDGNGCSIDNDNEDDYDGDSNTII